MANNIEVLMMGGRRCGKTSALSSIFDNMMNGTPKKYFTVADKTKYETKKNPKTDKDEMQDQLLTKKAEMSDFLEKGIGKEIIVDAGPTSNYWLYTLRLQVPANPNLYTDLKFYDAAGEFFSPSLHDDETTQFVKECDVFVVVIDTPYLMREDKLVTAGLNMAYNRIGEIQNFLTSINDKDGTDAKQVIFVPIKCEKWYKERRLEEVSAKVKEVYDSTITNLAAYTKIEISIIPIITMGGIEFVEMKQAKILLKNGQMPMLKCCEAGKLKVRLADGSYYTLKPDDKVNLDPNSTIDEDNPMVKPNSWFKIDNKELEPYNCDQLALHIIRFMMRKGIAVRAAATAHKGFFWLLWDALKSVFGTMPLETLKNKMDDISRDQVIRDSGNGITIIKQCTF